MSISTQPYNIYTWQILDIKVQLQNRSLLHTQKLKLEKQLQYLKHVKICFDTYKQVMENKNERY